MQEAYSVLKNPNDRAFYDQMRGTSTTDSFGNRQDMGVATPPGYHMHPAYAARKHYDSKSRRGLYGAMDLLFSRKGMYVLLAAPVLAMFYLGVSSLGPTKSELYEMSLRSGFVDDTHVKYANVDAQGNAVNQGMELVHAFWHVKKQRWLRPETWSNIQQIGANRQLTLVREYKTREDWSVPPGYIGPDTERELQEAAAKRADLLGIPRKLTDSEKEQIVLARLKERNAVRDAKIKARLLVERKKKRKEKIQKTKEKVNLLKKKQRSFGLPPPK